MINCTALKSENWWLSHFAGWLAAFEVFCFVGQRYAAGVRVMVIKSLPDWVALLS